MDKTYPNPSISRPPLDCVHIITPFIPDRNDTISFLLATSANGDINYHLDRSVKNRWISAKYDDDAFWASCLKKKEFMQRLNSVHVEQVPIPRKPFHGLASIRKKDWTDEKGLQANDVLVHATNLYSLSISHGERSCIDPPLSQAWIVLGQNESLKHFRIAIEDYGLSCFHGYKMLQNLTSIEIYLYSGVMGTDQSEQFSVNLCHFIGQNVQLESVVIREHCRVNISLVSLLLNTSINRLHTLKLCGRLSLRRDANHIIDAWKLQTGRNGVNLESHFALADAEHYFNILPETEPITRFLMQNKSSLRVLHFSIPEQFYTVQNVEGLPPLDLDYVSGLPSVVQSIVAYTCLPRSEPPRAVNDGHVGDPLDLNVAPLPEKIPQRLHTVHNLSLTPRFFEDVLRYEKGSGDQVKGRDATLIRKFWECKDNSDTFPPSTIHEVTLSSLSCIRRLTVGSARDISDIFNLGEFFTELEVLHIAFEHLQDATHDEPDAARGGSFVRADRCPSDSRPCRKVTLGKYLAKKKRKLKLANQMISAPKNIRKLGVWLAALSPLRKLKAFHGAPLFGLELTVDEPQEYSDEVIDERLKKIADVLPALETLDHWSDPSLMVRLFRDDLGALTRWGVDEAPKMWNGAEVPQWPHST